MNQGEEFEEEFEEDVVQAMRWYESNLVSYKTDSCSRGRVIGKRLVRYCSDNAGFWRMGCCKRLYTYKLGLVSLVILQACQIYIHSTSPIGGLTYSLSRHSRTLLISACL